MTYNRNVFCNFFGKRFAHTIFTLPRHFKGVDIYKIFFSERVEKLWFIGMGFPPIFNHQIDKIWQLHTSFLWTKFLFMQCLILNN